MKIPINMIDVENRINKIETTIKKIIPKTSFQKIFQDTDDNVKTDETIKQIVRTAKTNHNIPELNNIKNSLIQNTDEQSGAISDIINEISKKYNVDNNLIEAIAQVESDKDPKAISSIGATGVMQLMPETAKYMGVQDIKDTYQNIEGGIKYVTYLQDKFGDDLEKVLAAYNSGPSNVDKYEGIPPFEETQNYVKKVLDTYNNLK